MYNIIYLFSDQQRADTVIDNPTVSPNLNELAKSGFTFENAFTPQPVCGPARACVQTGRYATKTGCYINGINLPEDVPTLAKQLKEQGYNTAYVGKWHLASNMLSGEDYETAPVPLERRGGFDDYWFASDVLEFTSDGFSGYVFDKYGKRVEFNKYRTDAITDFALDYIDKYQSNNPFFLFTSYIEPHHQNSAGHFQATPSMRALFENFCVPEDLRGKQGDFMEEYPDYLGCCASLDYNVGRVVELLKAKNLFDNTIIIYTSDHGCHFRTLNSEYKRTAYENTIKIPLIIRGGAFKAGVRIKGKVDLLDLTATILDIAGSNLQTDGKSFYGKKRPNKDIFIQISESSVSRAIRTDRYKYVVTAPDRDGYKCSHSNVYEESALFDLKKDKTESKNLIYDIKYASVRRYLRRKMRKMLFNVEKQKVLII